MIKNYLIKKAQASILPLQGIWVGSLVGDLRYHKPHDMAKKKKKTHNEEHFFFFSLTIGIILGFLKILCC